MYVAELRKPTQHYYITIYVLSFFQWGRTQKSFPSPCMSDETRPLTPGLDSAIHTYVVDQLIRQCCQPTNRCTSFVIYSAILSFKYAVWMTATGANLALANSKTLLIPRHRLTRTSMVRFMQVVKNKEMFIRRRRRRRHVGKKPNECFKLLP